MLKNGGGKVLPSDHNANDNFPLTPGPSPTHAGRGEQCSRMAVARYYYNGIYPPTRAIEVVP
jgi:hypothetical protein